MNTKLNSPEFQTGKELEEFGYRLHDGDSERYLVEGPSEFGTGVLQTCSRQIYEAPKEVFISIEGRDLHFIFARYVWIDFGGGSEREMAEYRRISSKIERKFTLVKGDKK